MVNLRIVSLALVILSTLLFVSMAYAADISIGVIGDQTGSDDLKMSYQVMAAGVKALNEQKVDVILHVGDMVESRKSLEDMKKDFSQAAIVLQQLQAPWYLTPGDHDTNPPAFKQDSEDRSREAIFRSLYTPINPLAATNFYYSFDVKGYHLVSLYSQEHLHTDPRWGNAFMARISDRQVDWLKKDLASMAKGTKGVVIFTHQPLWYNWTSWMKIQEILQKYPVVCVIAGHFHYNQIEPPLSGITYLTVGATGATTKDADLAAGGLQHVSVVNITGREAQYRIIPLNAAGPAEFTSRAEMDRIQALELGLDNGAYKFKSNKVYVKNRRLVNDCKDDRPAVLAISSVGNPIEDDVTFDVAPATPAITLKEGKFSDGVCRSVVADTRCVMPPGSRVAVSNTSIVLPDEYTPPPYIWQGTPVLSGAAGDIEVLPIRVGFVYDAGPRKLSVTKTYSLDLVRCQ